MHDHADGPHVHLLVVPHPLSTFRQQFGGHVGLRKQTDGGRGVRGEIGLFNRGDASGQNWQ